MRRSSSAPVSRSDPKTSVYSSKGSDQDGASLVALAEDLEEEFCPGAGQWDEAQLVDDQQVQPRQLPLEVEQPPLVPGLHQFVPSAAVVVKPKYNPRWQAAIPSPRATWVLPPSKTYSQSASTRHCVLRLLA